MQQCNSSIKFITTYLQNQIDSSNVENEIIEKNTINHVNRNNSYDVQTVHIYAKHIRLFD